MTPVYDAYLRWIMPRDLAICDVQSEYCAILLLNINETIRLNKIPDDGPGIWRVPDEMTIVPAPYIGIAIELPDINEVIGNLGTITLTGR